MTDYALEKFSCPTPTPDDELCSCTGERTYVVMTALGFNPIHCLACNLEVRPEELPIPDKLVDELRRWHRLAAAFEALWLDSGAYEAIANEVRSDLSSPFNRLGLQVTNHLSTLNRSLYWLSMPEDAKAPFACPGCCKTMEAIEEDWLARHVCWECKLLVSEAALSL